MACPHPCLNQGWGHSLGDMDRDPVSSNHLQVVGTGLIEGEQEVLRVPRRVNTKYFARFKALPRSKKETSA